MLLDCIVMYRNVIKTIMFQLTVLRCCLLTHLNIHNITDNPSGYGKYELDNQISLIATQRQNEKNI